MRHGCMVMGWHGMDVLDHIGSYWIILDHIGFFLKALRASSWPLLFPQEVNMM